MRIVAGIKNTRCVQQKVKSWGGGRRGAREISRKNTPNTLEVSKSMTDKGRENAVSPKKR